MYMCLLHLPSIGWMALGLLSRSKKIFVSHRLYRSTPNTQQLYSKYTTALIQIYNNFTKRQYWTVSSNPGAFFPIIQEFLSLYATY